MSQEDLNKLLKSLKMKDGKAFKVTVEGSLGLLALGDIGLIVWRLARQDQSAQESRIQ